MLETLEKLKEGEIDKYIEIGKLAFYDKDYGVIKLNEDIKYFFGKNDINLGEFFVLKLNNEIIGTSFLVSRKHDLSGIDIFNVAIREDLKGQGYGTKMMNLIFGKIKEHKKNMLLYQHQAKYENFIKNVEGIISGKYIQKKMRNIDFIYIKNYNYGLFNREIQEKDFLEIAILYKKLRKVSENHMFEGYSKLMKNAGIKSDEQVIVDVIIPKYKKENSKLLVLKVDKKIIGFIYGTLFFNNDLISVYNDYNYIGGELNHLFIDEKYRGNGFSTKLKDELFKWFKEQKVFFIEIGVNNSNPSYEIYKKWGFEEKFCYVSKKF